MTAEAINDVYYDPWDADLNAVPDGISIPDFRISSTTPLAELKVW